MKNLVALALILVSIASSEPQRYRAEVSQQRQNSEASPYNPSGWRPSGPSFNTPERSSIQQSSFPSNPQQSYGPPPQTKPDFEPPVEETENKNSTTETSSEQGITENPQTENIRTSSKTGKLRDAAEKSERISQPGNYFLFVPRVQSQLQNLVIPETPLPEEKIASVLPVSQVYEFPYQAPQKTAALVSVNNSPLRIQRIVPVTSFFKNEIYSPFSSAFVQVYQ